MVYVTGSSVTDGFGNSDYLTFAYDALTGAVDWHRYYHGPANTDDEAQDLAVSHDGSTLYVTGASMNPDWECATVAYDGASGRTRWVRRIHSRYPETNGCVGVDVAPDDSRVVLSGAIGADNTDFLTLALKPVDGAIQWRRRWDGPAHGFDEAYDDIVSSDGSTVYAMGPSAGEGTGQDYALLAYDAATGAMRWGARYDGPASGDDSPMAIAENPKGTVFLTGEEKALGDQYDYDFGTVAYSASGKRLWVRHYSSRRGADDVAWSIAASPTSPEVFVTGMGNALYQTVYTTIAYTI
jgi:hypothetical protein